MITAESRALNRMNHEIRRLERQLGAAERVNYDLLATCHKLKSDLKKARDENELLMREDYWQSRAKIAESKKEEILQDLDRIELTLKRLDHHPKVLIGIAYEIALKVLLRERVIPIGGKDI